MTALVREFTPTLYSAPNLWQQLGIAERGPKLYQALHEGFSYSVFDKLATVSMLDKKQLAQVCQLAPATLARRAKLGKFTQEESDRLHRFATVLVAANALFDNDMPATKRWLTEPVYGLGDKAPLDMLATSAETQAILDLIGRLEHGVFA
ncbi:putative toxin-antitoxin system antitoxin component (TIGR02293 family) [Rheinheimera pacifica]|uniref:type II RES/Xre toxin-antitoxin system antitoxin n=1 Tax=Rheinheimera pacifica TaxID=173990 RepID=UPI002863C209|nr:antitoxin Xre/MbcA/ParS toxin-binding domain-containing protein [Rheinheimera pacifica]MDR6984073.1 putative toxin-antitoxin system antitoxin component (TIGR02293 family) [Rheinheimera pacifica]